MANGTSYRKDHCTTNNGAGFAVYPTADSGSNRLSDDNDVSYTCLTVDDSPDSVKFDGIGINGMVVPLKADPSGPDISKVTIKWTPTTTPSTSPSNCPADTNNSLRSQADWNCGYALLRADLTVDDGPFDHAKLIGNTLTGFFEPLNNNPGGAGQLNFGNQKGKPNLLPAQCVQAATYDGCKVTITNLPNNTFNVALRISSLYQTSNIQVEAQDNGGNPIPVSGVQASIDVTGKAQDVLRRINVRMPLLNSGGPLPTAAIQSSGSICKRFLTSVDYFGVDGGIVDADTSNPMCDGSISDISPTANAGLTSDCASSCVPGWTPPVGGKYKYIKTFTNQSNNPPGSVAGCTWDFGDGTPVVTDTSCQFNDTIVHTSPTLSPEPAYPAACLSEHFTALLTVRLTNGAIATKTHNYAMPLCV